MTRSRVKGKSRLSKREQKALRARRQRAKFEAKLAKLVAANDRRARELCAIIRADVSRLVDAEGLPNRIQDLPEDLRLTIADCDVDPTTGRIRRVKFKDKIAAAEKLFRMIGEADKPEVIALLEDARQSYQRAATILEAMQKMRDDTGTPGSLN